MANLSDLKIEVSKKKKKRDGKDKYKAYPFYTSDGEKDEEGSDGGESAGLDVEAKKGRCWKGYKPVPGKKPYSEDSCEKKKEKSSIESESKKTNPWAVCHTTVNKDKDPDKYERCVQDVKKSSINLGILKRGIEND